MKRIAILFLSGLVLAGCNDSDNAPEKTAADIPINSPGAMVPQYQMRAALPDGDRTTSTADGEVLFSNRCGACHLPGGMGTNLLTKQRVEAGYPPESGLLANRTDLTAQYVIEVVRHGKVAMPPQTRVDVTDAELAQIAAYLEGAKE
ncbi:c-type cytochrome [Emcibacter nanhaiensis]|uniref:Cytochrome c n=1 Tax=Emcibacter nanhaiensis TaxID=1505037 RepID=A0A501PCW2_9PROT|nr:cytochrome c [Emcibacter nanhaiensis]TPD57862.1 cytochrome c [Emcibacter nanhaiensis]